MGESRLGYGYCLPKNLRTGAVIRESCVVFTPVVPAGLLVLIRTFIMKGVCYAVSAMFCSVRRVAAFTTS